MRKDEDRENAVFLTSASLINFRLRADAAMGAYTAIVKVAATYQKHKGVNEDNLFGLYIRTDVSAAF